MLVAVVHFIQGAGNARPLVRRLMNALPSGSYLAITHFTHDFLCDADRATYWDLFHSKQADFWPRDRAEFTALFDDLQLIEPGIVPVSEWRPPTTADEVELNQISMWAGLARKP